MTTLARELFHLRRLLRSGCGAELALGWSDDGNEVLRLYDEDDREVAAIEALGGYVAVTVSDPGPEESDG